MTGMLLSPKGCLGKPQAFKMQPTSLPGVTWFKVWHWQMAFPCSLRNISQKLSLGLTWSSYWIAAWMNRNQSWQGWFFLFKALKIIIHHPHNSTAVLTIAQSFILSYLRTHAQRISLTLLSDRSVTLQTTKKKGGAGGSGDGPNKSLTTS